MLVDDVFVFYKANKNSLNNLMQALHAYGSNFGKWLNPAKRQFYIVDCFVISIEGSIYVGVWYSLFTFHIFKCSYFS